MQNKTLIKDKEYWGERPLYTLHDESQQPRISNFKLPQSQIQNFQFTIQICHKAKFKILNSKFKIAERFNSKFLILNSKLPQSPIQNS